MTDNNNDNQEKEVEDSDPLPSITHNETIEFYDKVILYLEQQESVFDTKKEELKCFRCSSICSSIVLSSGWSKDSWALS